MKISLGEASTRELLERLQQANSTFASVYREEPAGRQPIHTVYGGAHLFKSGSAQKLGGLALRAMEQYAASPEALARAVDLPASLAATIHERVKEKLGREPVEDYRIDFEDGYGIRPPSEEDGHAESAAAEVAKGLSEGTLPPSIGIRVKPFNEELKARGVRTLDIFISSLWEKSGGVLPPNLVITLPKVTIPEQVSALAELFDILESELNIPRGTLKMELMIETTQALIDARGRVQIPLLLEAATDRCVAAHFGAYDYTAACGIAAAHQTLTHPACDFARHMMQVSLAGTGIWLSDGATNVLPVPVHRERAGGPLLSEEQARENRAAVHRAWKTHYDNVQSALVRGYYQGWDLHPAQLVTRYAALHAFFLQGLDAAAERLRSFVEKAAQATLVGGVFDDAATGQGLLNYFVRGMSCGAVTEEEALRLTGLSVADFKSRSFTKILDGRRA